jgi:hypothetical protein
MPSSAVSTFNDPHDYTTSFDRATAELSIIERGSFEAQMIQVNLDRLRIHRFYERLARVGHWANSEARAIVTFGTQPGPTLLFAGMEMRLTNNTQHNVYENGFLRSSGPASWGSMSLPVEEMVAAGTVAGCDLTPPKRHLIFAPAPFLMTRLQRLHAWWRGTSGGSRCGRGRAVAGPDHPTAHKAAASAQARRPFFPGTDPNHDRVCAGRRSGGRTS